MFLLKKGWDYISSRLTIREGLTLLFFISSLIIYEILQRVDILSFLENRHIKIAYWIFSIISFSIIFIVAKKRDNIEKIKRIRHSVDGCEYYQNGLSFTKIYPDGTTTIISGEEIDMEIESLYRDFKSSGFVRSYDKIFASWYFDGFKNSGCRDLAQEMVNHKFHP